MTLSHYGPGLGLGLGSGLNAITAQQAGADFFNSFYVREEADLYILPDGFFYNPDFRIFRTEKMGGVRYHSDFDFEDRRPKGLAIYVDFENGSDGNDGLSETTPLRSFDTALDIPDVVEIYIKRGTTGRRTQISAGANIFPRSMSILTYGEGDNPRLTSGENNPAWVQNVEYPEIWQFTRSNTDDVFDFADAGRFDSLYKYHRPMALRHSVAEVAANPGSYYIDADNVVYLRTYDSRMPDEDIIVALNVPGLDCRSDIDLFIHGIDVYGFDFNLSYNQSAGTRTLAVKDCKFVRAPNGDGLFIRDAGFVYFQNILVAESHEDGINYKTSSTQTRFLEENCVCIRCGVSLSGNDNGSSAHDGVDGIRLGGVYAHNFGPNLADTNAGTQTLNLGVHAFSSELKNGASGDADFWCSNGGEMWLQDCSTLGSTSAFGRSVLSSATITDLGGYVNGAGDDNGAVQ